MTTPAQKRTWYLSHKGAAALASKEQRERYSAFWKKNDPYLDMTLKTCPGCEKPKARREFYIQRTAPDGLRSCCRMCDREKVASVGPTVSKMLSEARKRSKKKGLEFNLSKKDIVIPEFCPVLGMKLEFHRERRLDNSPSLDRIEPSQGYIQGNVRVISQRANLLKSNATLEELEKVLLDARQLHAVKEIRHAA